MPEEQAFCVLVKIMYEYGLRALYKNNFEDLHCKFYQLERLTQVSNAMFHQRLLEFFNALESNKMFICWRDRQINNLQYSCEVKWLLFLFPHNILCVSTSRGHCLKPR